MRAALIQLRVSSGEVPAQRWMRVERMLSQLMGQCVDLILLPELWSVGFSNFARNDSAAVGAVGAQAGGAHHDRQLCGALRQPVL